MLKNRDKDENEKWVSSCQKSALDCEIIEKQREKENNKEQVEIDKEEWIYQDFCNKYTTKIFEVETLETLEQIYQDGCILIDLYYITMRQEKSQKLCSETTIMHMQHIVGSVIYAIENKRYEKNLENSKQLANVGEEIKNTKKDIDNINSNVNNIMATVISIILSISVINSAIVGIENIDSNYILPFVSSIVFFGMVMIIFVYAIYNKEIHKNIGMIVITTFIITVLLWIASINRWQDISKIECNKVDIIHNQMTTI